MDVRRARDIWIIIINIFKHHNYSVSKKALRYARNTIIKYAWYIIHSTATYFWVDGRAFFKHIIMN